MTSTINQLILLLGSNLGNRILNLEKSKLQLEEVFQKPIAISSVYETEAWGKTDQPNFLNQVIIFNVQIAAHDCLKNILQIEKKLGRERLEKMGPRTIDIDILFFNDLIVRSNHLTIPHPHLQDRRFVLEPLNELIPNFVHPILNKSVQVMLQDCRDTLNVKKF